MDRATPAAPQLILASSSPRRQAFLQDLGLIFEVIAADVDETPRPGEAPVALAARLAGEKARAVACRLPPGAPPALVIAADTVVALGETLLGKPADDAEAAAMLRSLRGRDHDVISAVSVLHTATGAQHTRENETLVTMRDYSDDEIAAYVAGGDPHDKAGAYAIQHAGFHPVTAVRGCVASVTGLPLADLCDILREFGIVVTRELPPICNARTPFGCCQSRPDSLDG
jgi:septum formation protein